ncbi:MAG: 7-cyano-7-deazaguanine synthase [Actinobacteria bacterium]|nr:7-cyano-7-deazaguanine synthase [Actinomycetota bacterium]
MSKHRMHLSLPKASLASLSTSDFLWRPLGEPSSFHTKLSPRAEEMGAVPDENLELIRLAALTYLVDRTAPRPGRGWARELELVVPVFDPDRWAPIVDRVAATLAFLTGDVWEVSFVAKRSAARRKLQRDIEPAERVSLFSGGADSLCGLLASLNADVVPHLVSHWDWTIVGGAQDRVVGVINGIVEAHLTRDVIRIGRQRKQIGSNHTFPSEPTSRSRSLLFIALGLAAASVRGAELWVPENGFASLNLPLARERRGALSTRTTHPWLLDELQALVAAVGIQATIRNPFEQMTKGEMFRQIASDYGADDSAAVLSSTHSCARSGANYEGFNPGMHCGVCFGCLVRRAAFIASGVEDGTTYIEDSLRAKPRKRSTWLRNRREDVAAVEYRAKRPYEIADVLAASLPARVDPDDALALANRGAAELARVTIPS